MSFIRISRINFCLVFMSIIFSLSMQSCIEENISEEIYSSCKARNHVCGFIDNQFLNSVQKLVFEGYQTIIITSDGGFHTEAFSLVDFINENNIQVKIDGICLSTCAQEVVLGVDNIYLADNSIVGFHQSASFLEKYAMRHFDINSKYLSYIKVISGYEKDFFSQNKIDLEALYVPSQQLQYACISDTFTKYRKDLVLYAEPKISFYVPSREVLKIWRKGRSFEGGISTSNNFIERTKYYPNFLKKNKLAFGNISNSSYLNQYIDTITIC